MHADLRVLADLLLKLGVVEQHLATLLVQITTSDCGIEVLFNFPVEVILAR